ncbi:hypothetical protein C8Q70DRAFT_282827 [Cubamyces menziesii]|nr:hypothetical protein C8Q70DRAFT_282827 [Cubamyces menziesii]
MIESLKADGSQPPETILLPPLPPTYTESVQGSGQGYRPQGHAPNDSSPPGLSQPGPLVSGQNYASPPLPTPEGQVYSPYTDPQAKLQAHAQYAAPPYPPPPASSLTLPPPLPPPGAAFTSQATALSVGAQYQEQLLAKCAAGDHDMVTKHGAGGIIAAVCLFPIGLLCLMLDAETRCVRCGVRA